MNGRGRFNLFVCGNQVLFVKQNRWVDQQPQLSQQKGMCRFSLISPDTSHCTSPSRPMVK